MYSQVGNQYEKLRWKTMSGRQIEAAVLQKAALRFRQAQPTLTKGVMSEEAEEAILFNRRVWDILRAGWRDDACPLPDNIRSNLLNLSVFMAKAELEFRAKPNSRQLDGMIRINETLASGLEANSRVTAAANA